MTRRKIAFGLGFAAIGLLLAEYIYLITWIVLGVPPEEGNGLTGIVAVTTGTYLLPAIVAAIFLLVGRKSPHEGGILEMWEGGLGLFIGLFLFIPVFKYSTYQPMGFFVAASFFVNAALLLVSGFMFWTLAKKRAV